MDQIKPGKGTQRKRLGACSWKVTAAAAVAGSATALCLGILLGECAARYILSVYHSKREVVCTAHSKNPQNPPTEIKMQTPFCTVRKNYKGCSQLMFSVCDFGALYLQCVMIHMLYSFPA